MRFEDRLRVEWCIDPETYRARVPHLLLQPLVENAIRHGIAPRVSGGHVEVAVTRSDATLTVRVRDNGVGLRQDWRLERDAGIGLHNVASRLEHLYHRSDLLHVGPAPSGGVDVRIDLPLHLAPPSPAAALRAATIET